MHLSLQAMFKENSCPVNLFTSKNLHSGFVLENFFKIVIVNNKDAAI
jgi:hypothetical protein